MASDALPPDGPLGGDSGWLRKEIEQLREQVRAVGTALANQQSVFVDIAGARTAQLQAALTEVAATTEQLRSETDRLRQLEDAIAHHLHDLVLDVVQPELRSQLGQQLPQLVVGAMAPEVRRALSELLPQIVAETVRGDVRQLLSDWLPVMVADTVQPEVRQALAERLPDITASAVQPELRRILAERLPELVADTVQPELRRTLAERLPELVAETVQPELRQTLADRLPHLVSETVRPEVREALNAQLPGIVSQVVTPEVRRTLIERLPHLVTESVQPELRQVLGERLPGIVAETVSPSVGALLAERLPAMLAETITPELSVTLAEMEGSAAELRAEAAKIRGLREVVAERLPETVIAAVEPHLQEVLAVRFPQMVSDVINPLLREVLTDQLPSLVAAAVQPDVSRTLGEQVPALVADTIRPELRQALNVALHERLPGVVGESVRPELRERLAETLPEVVRQVVTPELLSIIGAQLPGLVGEAVNPDLSVSLAEVEACAAEMRAETARLRNLREVVAERLPQAVMSAVETVLDHTLSTRLPDLLKAVVQPAIAQALVAPLPETLNSVLEPALQAALARELPDLVGRAIAREVQLGLGESLPALVAATAEPSIRAALIGVEESAGALGDLRAQVLSQMGGMVKDAGAASLTEFQSSAVELRSQAEGLRNLRFEVLRELPKLVEEVVAVPLAEFEASAAQLRGEAERLRSLRAEVLAELPRLAGESLETTLADFEATAAQMREGTEQLGQLREAVLGEMPRLAAEAMAAPLADFETSAARLQAEAEQLRALHQEVLRELPRLAAQAVAGPLAEFQASAAELLGQGGFGDRPPAELPGPGVARMRDEAEALRRLQQEVLSVPQLVQEAVTAALAEQVPRGPALDETLREEIGTMVQAAITSALAHQAAGPPRESGGEPGRDEPAATMPAAEPLIGEPVAPVAVAEPTSAGPASAGLVERLPAEAVAATEEAGSDAETGVDFTADAGPGAEERAEAAPPVSAATDADDTVVAGTVEPAGAGAAEQSAEPAELSDWAVFETVESFESFESVEFVGTGEPGERAGAGAVEVIAGAAEVAEPATAGDVADAEAAAPFQAPPDEPVSPEAAEWAGTAGLAPAAATDAPGIGSQPERAEVAGPEPSPEPSPEAEPEAEPQPADPALDAALAVALARGRVPDGARASELPPVEDEASTLACVLPGVVVGPTLARGIGEAVTRARLRRRRRRRAGPPAAGLHRRDPFSGDLTRRLEWFDLANRQATNGAEPTSQDPGLIAVGERGGREVTLSLGRIGGLCLLGPRAREVARAMVLTFLADNGPEAARAIVVGDLLPAATTFPGLGRTRDVGAIIGGLQAEAARRRGLLAQAGVEDLATYHAHRPDEPLPLILVAAAEMTGLEADRLRSLIGEGAGVGILGLVVDAPLEGMLALSLQGNARVTSQSGEVGTDDELVGARLFTVDREPAVELLDVLASSRDDAEGDGATPPADQPFEVVASPSPLVSLRILGGYRIDANQKEIRSGLRAKARELLAFYLLHPEGTTLEEATEALWPEADARRGSEWFWTALGNLRSRLRSATENPELKVIEREGDRYRIEPVFDVDLWRFQGALAHAGASSGDPSWPEALQAAADLYSGELLAGSEWPWCEVPREDLRSRAVDVLVSMAATRLVAGEVQGALAALERAVDIDPLAEQLYRRIMRLHAKLGRPDQADALFRTLQARLGEINLQPSDESEKLHTELCGTP